jgi:hypothetical protein
VPLPYVCMYYVCVYVCVCIVCMCVCMHVYMYVFVCLYVCMCVCVCIYVYNAYMCVCMYYLCMYVLCVYVCIFCICVCTRYVLFMYICMYMCMYTCFGFNIAPIADSLRTKPLVCRHDINLPHCNRKLFNWSLAVSLASSRANGPAAYLTIVTAHLTIDVNWQWSNVLCSAYHPAEGMITDCIVTQTGSSPATIGCAVWCLWRYCGGHCVLRSDLIS